ncbi:MAG: cache domain-containing protein [Candidatus Margulisbacteria bacterium]|nr:cache domain-containing protein [Candidatus Margulisiibacteriota bacterium]
MKKTVLLIVVLLGLMLPYTFGETQDAPKDNVIAAPEDNLTKEQVVGIVDEAAKLLTQKGDDALKIIGETNGKFHKGELYVFVYDENITMLAHPEKPSLVGKNFKGKPDVKGFKFRDEIVAKALAKGSGWTDYMYQKPESTGIFKKTTYGKLAKFGDKKYIVCAGMYAK